jgi:hypothetical protein
MAISKPTNLRDILTSAKPKPLLGINKSKLIAYLMPKQQ